jgi:endonuclease YncB( thermonuclease family)
MRALRRSVVVLLLLLLPQITTAAQNYEGKVVAVSDGDTIRVFYKGGELKVRLAEIDTPEKNQPYGTRARQALSDLVFGRQVRVAQTDRDRYGRIVGRVYVDGADVNAEMIKRGHAWVYRQYAQDPALYRLENEARAAKRGLWALPEAERVPPWEWRHAGRGKTVTEKPMETPRIARSQTATMCESKRTCGEMTSCDEARFYLSECGLSRLDGNHDGIPCESLCR